MFLNLEIIKQGFFNKINYNWKEKLIRNIFQTGFFPHKKIHITLWQGLHKWEVPRKFPTLLRQYKLWVT